MASGVMGAVSRTCIDVMRMGRGLLLDLERAVQTGNGRAAM